MVFSFIVTVTFKSHFKISKSNNWIEIIDPSLRKYPYPHAKLHTYVLVYTIQYGMFVSENRQNIKTFASIWYLHGEATKPDDIERYCLSTFDFPESFPAPELSSDEGFIEVTAAIQMCKFLSNLLLSLSNKYPSLLLPAMC